MSRSARNSSKAAGAEYVFFFLNPLSSDLAEVVGMVDAGLLVPQIDMMFSGLDAYRDAFKRLESKKATGKIIISVLDQ